MDVKKEIIEWVKVIIISFLIAFFLHRVVLVNAEVPTGSMENNIMIKDRIIALRFAYYFNKPKRYDIVVFNNPDNEKDLFVKRVIGLPGETLNIVDGLVYVDGSTTPLVYDYVKDYDKNENLGPFKVPEGKYFMMGDNRINSHDSRYWVHKYVDSSKIIGKVVFRYFPKLRLYKDIVTVSTKNTFKSEIIIDDLNFAEYKKYKIVA